MPAVPEPPEPASRWSSPTAARLTLHLLPRFELVDHRVGPITLPVPAQRVVAFLAVHDCALQRGFVAGSLWPDSSEAKAHGSLRSALWRLSAAAPGAITSGAGSLCIGPTVSCDLVELFSAARALGRGQQPSAELDPLALWFQDELLTDWYDDWVVIWRERWRHARLHALEALARRLADHGRFDAAIDCALAAVVVDPLRETSHRVLIELHLLEGNRAEARRAFDAYRTLLARELGVEPDRPLAELFGTRNVTCDRVERRPPLLARPVAAGRRATRPQVRHR
jgi:DNA-binding SARP family transcriptional activator